MSLVSESLDRAEAAGFTIWSERPAGALLAVLSAAVPPGGRVLTTRNR
jgi:hypothetical protein